MSKFNMKVTPEIEKLTQICRENDKLDLSLYGKYDVKRGLRDLNGKGVLAGLTQISNVQATKIVDGKEVPCAGKLSYRGYDIKDLTNGFINDRRFGFEEVTYLLLFGKLPDQEELNGFSGILANQRMLPRNFVRKFVEFKELNRKVTKREYEKVLDAAVDMGIQNGFIQEGETASESFIPDFDYEGVEKNTP